MPPVRLAYLLIALGALVQSGCLALLVGAGVAGGCGAVYAYSKGKLSTAFAANLEDVRAATRSALADLGMPLKENPRNPSFLSRTADGAKVKIYFRTLTSRIPADGLLTQVSVRVGCFGDRDVSERILRQVGLHLAPCAAGPGQLLPPAPPPSRM